MHPDCFGSKEAKAVRLAVRLAIISGHLADKLEVHSIVVIEPGECGLIARAWRIMLIFLILCYASNAHLLNIYASRIYFYAQYYAHSGN